MNYQHHQLIKQVIKIELIADPKGFSNFRVGKEKILKSHV